jgi:hypothetical protein
MPELKASPRVNPKTGAVADFLKYLKSPKSSQQMQALMGVLPFVDDLETVLEDASYGRAPVQGKGMTLGLTPEGKSMVELATIFAPGGRAASQAAESGAMALGRVGEQYAERKVPEVMARGGRPAQLLSDLAKGTISPATVFHGSPHRFTKFDSSKIGTGEGAQAYGHGLYLAEAKDVAESYKDVIQGLPLSPKAKQAYTVITSDVHPYVKQKALANLPKEAIKEAKSFGGGNLYQVDLPDEQIAKMLDFDSPFNKQPKSVQEAIKASGIFKEYKANLSDFSSPMMSRNKNMRGENIMEFLEFKLGGPEQVAAKLRDLGISGVRYLDEGSRGAGKGTSNFVVFPGMEDMLRIDKINDSPLDLFLQNYKP